MTWQDRVKREEPRLKLHEPPEECGRIFIGKAEAHRLFYEMIEARMPRIAEGTERSR